MRRMHVDTYKKENVTQRYITKDEINLIKNQANDQITKVLDYLGINTDGFQNGYAEDIRLPCPIHGGDNPTAFSYSLIHKKWRCFTQGCHEDNDSIFGLIKLILDRKTGKDHSFISIVKLLINILNINHKLGCSSPEEIEISKIINKVKLDKNKENKINKDYFTPLLLSTINKKPIPSQYFLEKGFSKETLEHFRIGYCDNRTKPMYKRSYAPIIDPNGKEMVGVTGRIIYEKCDFCPYFHEQRNGCPTDNPNVIGYSKWKHYGFNKSEILYNIHEAKNYINKSIVLVEGPKDLWWLHQHDIKSCVSIFGVDISISQIKLLLSLGITDILLLLDNDKAGLDNSQKIIRKVNKYFNIININYILNDKKDIADISTSDMINVKKEIERLIC